MTRKTFITLFLILSLFLVGCKQQEATGVTGKAFAGGTQGLEVSFLSGLPPAEVFDIDNPFQVGLKIENKGEFNIESASNIVVTITGVNPSDFKVSSADLTKTSADALKGVSLDSQGAAIAGEYTTLEFPEMNYARAISGSIPFTIRANVCYEYGTKAQGQLCVRKDLRGVTADASLCNPDRTIQPENSGAPVSVSSMRQNVAGANKVDFFFTIRNGANTPDSLHKSGTNCGGELSNRDVVWVEVSDTGLGDLTCSGLRDGNGKTTGFVTLFNGEREVRCSQTITNPSDFETLVSINLRYAYEQFVDTRLTVKHAG